MKWLLWFDLPVLQGFAAATVLLRLGMGFAPRGPLPSPRPVRSTRLLLVIEHD